MGVHNYKKERPIMTFSEMIESILPDDIFKEGEHNLTRREKALLKKIEQLEWDLERVLKLHNRALGLDVIESCLLSSVVSLGLKVTEPRLRDLTPQEITNYLLLNMKTAIN